MPYERAGPFDHQSGPSCPDTQTIPWRPREPSALPVEPIDQSLEICLSIWTEPCSKGGMLAPPCAIPSTNRPPFGYREQIVVQSRPTSSRLDGDQSTPLEAYKNHTVVFGYGIGFVLWYSGYDSMHHLYDDICPIVKPANP